MLSETQQIASDSSEQLSVIDSCVANDWNGYLRRSGSGHLFLRAEWDDVFAVYGLKTLRVAAVRGDRVVGVLPLVEQRSILLGRQLVSLPWFDTAGVVADDSAAIHALVAKAIEAAEVRKSQIVQLRQGAPIDVDSPIRTDKLLMRLRLEPDEDRLWDRFNPKVRNQVRKAEKSGLRAEQVGNEHLPEFYRIYSQNMRDLGSPSHHVRFFEAVFAAFPAEASLFIVRFEGKAIGGALTMANGDRLEVPWASSLKRYNRLCVNHLLYWTILQHACRGGFEMFHFGRSTADSGTYRFKKQWGAEGEPLHWYYLTSRQRPVGAAMSPDGSYGWGARLWKRLPLWLTRRLGPKLIAGIP